MAFENKLNNLDEAIIVALGSNMPGPYASSQALLEAALAALDEAGLRIVRRSCWWRSAAWPDPADPPFLNGVAIVETALEPAAVLALLHHIEAGFGRDRMVRNAPRTLDLDLIAYGRVLSKTPALPHPRAHERHFVMGPLAEIASSWLHPIGGGTAKTLAAWTTVGLDAQPIFRQDQTMNEKPSGVEEDTFDWEESQDEAWIERNKVPLQKMIAEAEEDFAAGRTISLEDVMARIRSKWAEKGV
jgi:2-amino-4-hydroxy-6-hydroxymethyldihydropteridine diphosphokinase